MAEEQINTGIDIIGSVPWSTHFCQIYQSKQDLLDILVPYFKAGLEHNELCMWITSEPIDEKDARKALEQAIPEIQTYFERGQMELLPHADWYLKSGSFDIQRVLNTWIEKLDWALSSGFEGLRVTGNTAWLEKKDWKDFAEYETAINGLIAGRKMLAICTYCLDKCNALEIMDVMRNHEYSLVKQGERWELIGNTIAQQTRKQLSKSEERFRSIFENTTIGIQTFDQAGKLITANKASLEIFGVSDISKISNYHLFSDPNITGNLKERLLKAESVGYEAPFDFNKIKATGIYETCKSGIVYLDILITPLSNEANEITGYLVQVQDVTERKKIEEYLAQSKDELELRVKQRTIELEKLNQALNYEITQGKEVREALRQSKSQLEHLINAMSEGVTLIDQKGMVIKANPAMCRITGKEISAIEGNLCTDLGKRVFDADNNTVRKEDLPVANVLKTRQPVYNFELGLERDNGSQVWIKVNAVPLINESGEVEGIVRTLHDVSEQKRMEDSLRKNEAHLRLMLNQIPCMLWTTDSQLIFNLSLGAGLKTFNLCPNQIVGMGIFDYYNTSDPDFYPILAHRQALAGQAATYELHWEGKILDCYVEPLKDNTGKIIGVIGISFDITDKKQAEEALRALSRRLVDVQENERRNIARELHDEIGQSLTALKLMMTQVARSGLDYSPSSLKESQEVVTELIRQVRDMSLSLRPSMLDDLGLLPTLLWYIERYTLQTKIKVGFEHCGLHNSFSPEINTAIYRIIQEALTNVARHANAKEVNITVWADDRNIALKIEDHGRGFTPSALYSSSSTGISGMRERVLLLNGKLDIKTIPGSGTCLEAEIPLK
jgi:PAS domain S-box-containing protein